MASRHSAFMAGAPPGAIHSDPFARCGADAGDLEQAFSDLLREVRPERGIRIRIFIEGKPQALRPDTQEQLFLIGREAVVNALHHSEATDIEVEVQYLRCSVRMSVRDNGCGINPDMVQKESHSCWGLREMRDRAASISAQFGIWSRPGAGTEVRVNVPLESAESSRNTAR